MGQNQLYTVLFRGLQCFLKVFFVSLVGFRDFEPASGRKRGKVSMDICGYSNTLVWYFSADSKAHHCTPRFFVSSGQRERERLNTSSIKRKLAPSHPRATLSCDCLVTS